MLAEIASNPAAWPLWGVLVFAALMYPLGLLLPGCVCCGPSGCTQCGTFSIGYAAGQSENGAMCCTGTIAPSITIRLTNTGSATSSLVTRSASSGSYTKTTASFSCSALSGDYVIPLNRINFGTYALCPWAQENFSSCDAYSDVQVNPSSYDPTNSSVTVSFPSYYLAIFNFNRTFSGSFRVQTCSGFPGVESCNVGTTTSSSYWIYDIGRPFVVLSEQRCNPAGTVFGTSIPVFAYAICASSTIYPSRDTGCTVSVELV